MEQSSVQSPGRELYSVEVQDDDPPLERRHTWLVCYFIACGLSLCIVVDILQYSMPLAFLPSVLENRGHESMEIATAIGAYYWTGFLGQVCITSYQVFMLVTGRGRNEDVVTLSSVRRRIVYLIIGLSVGTVTLFAQALSPRIMVHTICRLIQGFAGAFIFFYVFLLCATVFEDSRQRNFAMTASSAALNVAEVLGSSLGAAFFEMWGQRSVFWFLGIVSVVNQFVLLGIIFVISAEKARPVGRRRRSASNSISAEGGARGGCGWSRLFDAMKSKRFTCSVILICMAAVVKGSMEEMLPFHADHRWKMDPIGIGRLFLVIAVSYIVVAFTLADPNPWPIWPALGRWGIIFSSVWLTLLGVSAWCVFGVYSVTAEIVVFFCALGFYGMCLGFTVTPAALLLAEDIDEQTGRARESLNGVWNMMWEAGGSIGFLLGGLLAHNYEGQLGLIIAFLFCCIACSSLMVGVVGVPGCCDREDKLATDKIKAVEYGTCTNQQG